MLATGRFAPSPTGPLHLGNLRTALASWLHARHQGGRWLVRMEDLDRVTSSPAHATDQLATLAELGLHWDAEVWRQSERFGAYAEAIDRLRSMDRVYPCYCSRREIREAASAPHADIAPDGADPATVPEGAYPGTCRSLDAVGRQRHEREGRRPALRLRTSVAERAAAIEVDDLVAGTYRGHVDDVVLQRNDGVPAYNLAVVVDDAAQGVTHVVRGDDLLASTPRQVLLQRLLDLPTPQYAHLPLVLGADGTRLAKRHGAVTLAALHGCGRTTAEVRGLLGASLGLNPAGTLDEWATRFRLDAVARSPWRLEPDPNGMIGR